MSKSPRSKAQLASPMVASKGRRRLVVIDEVQRAPDLFKVLRARTEVIEAGGLTLDETGIGHVAALWWRGGFPRSFLAPSDHASRIWRREFIRTVVERDLPQRGWALRMAAASVSSSSAPTRRR